MPVTNPVDSLAMTVMILWDALGLGFSLGCTRFGSGGQRVLAVILLAFYGYYFAACVVHFCSWPNR